MTKAKIFVGFDFGTTNVSAGRIYVDGDFVSHSTHFLKLDAAEDPYIIHCEIDQFVNDVLDIDHHFHYPLIYGFIEGVFKGPNQRTYQRMTRVGHSINIALGELGARVRYLGSTEWRKALFGKGNKPKEACQVWAYKHFPELLEFKKGEQGHRADAVMIAEAGLALVENGTIEEETPRPLDGQNS